MSSDHTLTIYFDGDEVVPVFRCTAKPSASGQPPACWTYLDEEGEFRVGDHCNAYEWIKHVGPYFLEREITLEVEVDWDDEAPQVVVSDPAKRIAELEAELAKFKECEQCSFLVGFFGSRKDGPVYHKEGELNELLST